MSKRCRQNSKQCRSWSVPSEAVWFGSTLFIQTCLCKNFVIPLVYCKLLESPHDKTNKVTVHPAKTQISLGIRPVWSESSLCAQWVPKDPGFLHAYSKDSDQTGWMPRLICLPWPHIANLLVLSWGGSLYVLASIFQDFIVDLSVNSPLHTCIWSQNANIFTFKDAISCMK